MAAPLESRAHREGQSGLAGSLFAPAHVLADLRKSSGVTEWMPWSSHGMTTVGVMTAGVFS
jgi:hypothetical protein